ncbi:periplasmic component of amino acid ABC-type transporter/signal transduction system [Synechococcus sp. PCC 7502]|uniref:amino acid ABC transporter substrate-binding protein n=1 Tax=Synechococcus sp. PCC 7502 TaxID=1173263 RepID=UPI00029F97B2|nr:amino acid ABC transporter substrate-binding protein [Synechococcus sp. PCC 7502]AFY73021.1 periplasmic component of amino acid ABC-type transporter/signal transduction system [Synechococcus sp. PCC 7502]
MAQNLKMMNLWKGREFKHPLLGIITGLVAVNLVACSSLSNSDQSKPPSRLDIVLSRGSLICGVSGEVPGFSFVNPQGKYSGLDVDICRAIAAALFNNPEAVEYRNLSAKERFTALQTGEIDILSRNTTLTASRDTDTGLEFAPVVFYDGQGIMVKKNSNIKSLADLKNASICMQIGTTHEANLTDQMAKRNIPYKPITFDDVNATFNAYQAGRCVAITADRSALSARRTLLPNSNDHVLLDVVLSKEPLAPAVKDGDSRWSNAVRWIVYGLIAAEELGITSKNINQQSSINPEIVRFLGIPDQSGKGSDLGKNMGLTNDFVAREVKAVGNYGEIYERNLGSTTKLNIDRGLNKLWTNGGLMYAPPFR